MVISTFLHKRAPLALVRLDPEAISFKQSEGDDHDYDDNYDYDDNNDNNDHDDDEKVFRMDLVRLVDCWWVLKQSNPILR